MKAIPVKIVGDQGFKKCDLQECTHVMIHIPSRTYPESLPVILKGSRDNSGGCWSWNGDSLDPTLRPSILTVNPGTGFRCHSFVNDGKAKFLTDCSHNLVGQEVDLLEVDPKFYQ
jgi:hypothetical protein